MAHDLMDILQLILQLRTGTLKEGTPSGCLKGLVEEAGKSREDWERNARAVEGELYECPTTENHKRIVTECKIPYMRALQKWLFSRNRRIVAIHMRHPGWLKRGSICTSDRMIVIIIPLPFEDCEVKYQPTKDDPRTRKTLIWQDPIFLQENSALILERGSIKFIVVDMEIEEVSTCEVGNTDLSKVKEEKENEETV